MSRQYGAGVRCLWQIGARWYHREPMNRIVMPSVCCACSRSSEHATCPIVGCQGEACGASRLRRLELCLWLRRAVVWLWLWLLRGMLVRKTWKPPPGLGWIVDRMRRCERLQARADLAGRLLFQGTSGGISAADEEEGPSCSLNLFFLPALLLRTLFPFYAVSVADDKASLAELAWCGNPGKWHSVVTCGGVRARWSGVSRSWGLDRGSWVWLRDAVLGGRVDEIRGSREKEIFKEASE